MNRDEVLNCLVTLVIYEREKAFVVALPTDSDVSEFRAALELKMQEVPDWLMPPRSIDSRRRINFKNYNSILIGKSVMGFRGITPSYIFADSRLPTLDSHWKEWLTFVALAYTKNPVAYFDNI